jgi:hypothetical protein
MKSIKYTLAALAFIALASFNTAKANPDGDVILGVFNTTNSLQFDLGSYGSLITAGTETWDLGNVTSTAGSNLQFSFAASSTNLSAAGGLPKQVIALGGVNIPTTTPSNISSEQQAITSVEGDQTTQTELEGATTGGSYAEEDNGNGFGLGGAYNIDQTWTGNDSASLYYLAKGQAPVDVGTFTTSTVAGDTTLTFNVLSTPEPSAYALGLTALALFWVLKRRSSTVA